MTEYPFNITVAEGLILHSATPQDAEIIYQAIDTNREDLRVWLPFIDNLHSVADEEVFLNSLMETPIEQRNITFLIKKDTIFCGLVGFVLTDTINHKTEIGYWLLPEFRHQGIMKRSVHTLINWAIEKRDMNRIQIKCATGNIASNTIPRKLGFQLEGIERDGELLINGYTDLNIYSLLAKEAKQTFSQLQR